MTRQEQEEAEQAAYEEHMQALYDEQNRMQQMTEQVEQLQNEVERLRAEVERERAAVVAYLRDQGDGEGGLHGWVMENLSNAIERGEHRREEEE
jgi:small-conductance mechanosensitive channel